MVLWLQFAFCTGIILVSATYLSKYGDVIAEKTGLGRTWIGVVLMASVTSHGCYVIAPNPAGNTYPAKAWPSTCSGGRSPVSAVRKA
jgi:hypothetical protein